MRFRNHIPDYVGSDPSDWYDLYGTIEEILSNDRINWRTKCPEHHRFSYASHNGAWSKALLMWEKNGGRNQEVVGYLSEVPDLPNWGAP